MKMHRLTRLAARFAAQTAMTLLCGLLVSCAAVEKYNDYDAAGGQNKAEYEALAGRRAPAPQARGEEPPIPNFASVLAAPSAPELADVRRVSIAVTETTPVRDILIELARKAQVDLEMDPRIAGGIIMTATDRPFIDVIGRIAELAELRYSFERNVLKVQVDDPYLEQYRMDMLNVTRTSSSSASSSTDASSAGQSIGASGGSSGGSNKSETAISTSTNSDLWSDIGKNVAQIMANIQTRRTTTTAAEGLNATFVPQAEKQAASPAAAAPAAAAAQGSAGTPAAGGLVAQAAGLSNRQSQLDANLAMASPAGSSPEPAAAGAPRAAAPAIGGSNYTLNPSAGIVTVFATQRQHKAVERYLRDVRESVGQQVLIEAKVMEITLNDNYRAGIDWTAVLGPSSGRQNFNFQTNFAQGVPSDLANPSLSGTWTGAILGRGVNAAGVPVIRNDLSLAAELVKQFGTVRTLSSPRLTVLNNQMAQLKVAENQVFFQLQVSVTDSTSTTQGKTTVASQIKSVPVGLIMSVQPAVNPVTKRITLSLRPSITRITGYVNDPGVAITIAVARQTNNNIPTITSQIPVIEAREMDSVVNLDSGQTVVMGGLMQEEVNTSRCAPFHL